MRSLVHSVAVLLLLAVGSMARSGEGSAVLVRARAMYEQGKLDSSAALIKAFLKTNGKDPAAEHLVPLLLESLVRLKDDRYSRKLINIYLRKYPDASYIARVLYLSGIVFARQEEYADAIGEFSAAHVKGLSPELDSLALSSVRHLCEKSLTAREASGLLRNKNLDPAVIEILQFCQTAKLYQSGKTEQAQQAARGFSKKYSHSSFNTEIKAIQQKARAQQRDQLSVGLLAPLTGYDADIGKQIVQGVQLAVDTYNRGHEYKVNLIIADTKGDMITTAFRVQELIRDHQVSVVLGPVLSPTAVAAAAMLAGKDIVMISPTATEDGIAQLDPNIFQMNVTMGVLGRKIAKYASVNLNIHEFAVMAPLSDYGRLLTESFKREVKAQGGEVVAEEWFDEGANDFRAQFDGLRNKLIHRRVDARSDVMPSGYESTQKSFREDSLRLADSVLAVGGLFIPAEADDVVMLAPQAAFYKVRTQLLGATGWHSTKVILDGKRYVNDAIIVTSFEINKQDPRWIDFSARYSQQFSGEPDRVAALGFDAASLLCGVVNSKGSGVSSLEITESLRAVRGYRGVSGLISFDGESGVNTEAAIVKISKKQFLRVQ